VVYSRCGDHHQVIDQGESVPGTCCSDGPEGRLFGLPKVSDLPYRKLRTGGSRSGFTLASPARLPTTRGNRAEPFYQG